MSTQTMNGLTFGSPDGTVAGRIAQLRQMQTDLSSKPVTGKLKALRKLFYQTIRSAFSRQWRVNAATVDLIESMYREIERQKAAPAAAFAEPIAALPAPATFGSAISPTPFAPPAGLFAAPAPAAAVLAPPKPAAIPQISTGQTLSSAGQVQDQAALNGIRPLTGFQHVYSSPAELRMPERVALYSIVFGLQPRNCLEIGTFRGGSTAIICGAMDDTGFGQLACVDPTPLVTPELWSQISHRCRMYQGLSPDILPQAARESGAPFDFAWIDGNHTYECLRADIAGVLPLLADNAYLLFHDAHYTGVKRAIDEAVARTPQLVDCGLMSIEPTVLSDNGQTTTWAGMRMLRFQRNKTR
jgi:predicted O-methyltransferase YrrM